MATVDGAKELLDYIKSLPKGVSRAAVLAHTKVMVNSKADAVRNAKQQFTGRNGRRLSGRLFNAIRVEIERPKDDGTLSGNLGTSGIPYGAIHEFGGEIEPVKANNLWLKNHDVKPQFKRMTPREFMTELKARRNPNEKFAILKSKSGNLTAFHIQRTGVGETARDVFTALFYLRDSVTIPKRPYITPAIVMAMNKFPAEYARFLESELN